MSDFGEFSFNLGDLGMDELSAAGTTVMVRDLWNHLDLGLFTDSIQVHSIPAYGSHAFRLRMPGSMQ
jgi:hypothetical protein